MEKDNVITTETEEEKNTQPEVKTFTQEEVDALIQKAKAQEKKKRPKKEEWEKFQAWKKEQEPEENVEVLELKKQLEEKDRELQMTRNRETLIKQGIDIKYLDYVNFEVSKMVDEDTDFETAMTTYLKDNSQFTKAEETKKPIATGMPQGGVSTKFDGVTQAFLKNNPDLEKEIKL